MRQPADPCKHSTCGEETTFPRVENVEMKDRESGGFERERERKIDQQKRNIRQSSISKGGYGYFHEGRGREREEGQSIIATAIPCGKGVMILVE